MKSIIVLTALCLASCASPSAHEATQSAPSTVYVQVVGPNGAEVKSDLATTIRDEAYVYYRSLGLTQAQSLAARHLVISGAASRNKKG